MYTILEIKKITEIAVMVKLYQEMSPPRKDIGENVYCPVSQTFLQYSSMPNPVLDTKYHHRHEIPV